MHRRFFLGFCATSSISALFASEQSPKMCLSKEIYSVIAAVQEHMFPQENTLPSATTFRATAFLAETLMHPTYDKDIRAFVIKGAEALQKRENHHFLTYDVAHKEKALRAYEETDYGGRWLDRIMLLSLEALLSDPIYGGNMRESGWHALQAKGGDPRPTSKYVQL